MPGPADPKGIVQALYRKASHATLCGCLQEVIANRKHGKNEKGVKFLLSSFTLQDAKYFIVGSTQYRSMESVMREFTPFASHSMSTSASRSESARLATAGVGGNLLYIRMNSTFSMLIQASEEQEQESFTTTLSDWNLIDWMYIKKMNRQLETDDPNFNAEAYRPNPFTPIDADHTYIPFFSMPGFRDTSLFTHIQEVGYRHFYIFKNPDTDLNTELSSREKFQSMCNQLSELYEVQLKNGEISIYQQYGLDTPISTIQPGTKLLIHLDNSIFIFKLDWKLADKKIVTETGREWWENTCRFEDHRGVLFYGKCEQNGQDKIDKNGKNRWNLKTVKACKLDTMTWRADIRVSIHRLKPALNDALTEEERAYLGDGVYLRIEDELLSDNPSYKDPVIRNLPGGFRYRIIVDILSKAAKDIPDSGLNLHEYKKISTIADKKSIAQCIKRTLSIVNRLLDSFEGPALNLPETYSTEEFYKKLQCTLDDRERAKARDGAAAEASRKGTLFEAVLGKLFEEKYKRLTYRGQEIEFKYDCNDAHIKVQENIESQACDILGKAQLADDRPLRIVIQAKAKSQVTEDDRLKFIQVVRELREKYHALNGVIIPIFVQKNVKSFSNLQTNHFSTHGIFLLSGDSEKQDEASASICESVKYLLTSL